MASKCFFFRPLAQTRALKAHPKNVACFLIRQTFFFDRVSDDRLETDRFWVSLAYSRLSALWPSSLPPLSTLFFYFLKWWTFVTQWLFVLSLCVLMAKFSLSGLLFVEILIAVPLYCVIAVGDQKEKKVFPSRDTHTHIHINVCFFFFFHPPCEWMKNLVLKGKAEKQR